MILTPHQVNCSHASAGAFDLGNPHRPTTFTVTALGRKGQRGSQAPLPSPAPQKPLDMQMTKHVSAPWNAGRF